MNFDTKAIDSDEYVTTGVACGGTWRGCSFEVITREDPLITSEKPNSPYDGKSNNVLVAPPGCDPHPHF